MEQGASTVCGVVRAVHGGQAEVAVDEGGCGRCHETGGCGGQNLGRMFAGAPRTYRVDNSLGVAVGERVTIAVAAGSVRRAANLGYGVPLLAAIAGALAGNALLGDAGAIGGALLAFAGAMLYVRRRSWATAGSPAGEPHIVSRSQPDQEVGRQ
ncbi:SoxR reducing system RseC family protein [Azonexus sp.]|jgi:sigma-E factor negative regulatory protein RseC|uniref:SoxR reducing system RseC family protein n=1 Tax=Azonexus sp. TaxID=1872668 RepID=UPI0028229253|nr:SoxR reducing system RseC family protein [Azonexus sp.]MDR1996374.1 SoxR reducing system RseC family protein [Azonexus sp.]